MSTLVYRLAVLFALFALGCSGASPDGDDDDTGDDTSGDDGFTDPVDGGDDCEPDVIPAPTGQACAAATRTCVDACTTDACWESCLTADPDPENCAICLEDGYLACANAAGCQAEWDAVICCYDGCADPEAPECETTCATSANAYDACIEPFDEMCAEMTDATCFPAT